MILEFPKESLHKPLKRKKLDKSLDKGGATEGRQGVGKRSPHSQPGSRGFTTERKENNTHLAREQGGDMERGG